jgi:hypothetical protein
MMAVRYPEKLALKTCIFLSIDLAYDDDEQQCWHIYTPAEEVSIQRVSPTWRRVWVTIGFGVYDINPRRRFHDSPVV